jgi:hypothetical protein
MGEANRTFKASLLDDDGIEYATYTAAELAAKKRNTKVGWPHKHPAQSATARAAKD